MKWSFIFIILMIAVISCVADNGIDPFGQQSLSPAHQASPFGQQSGLSSQQAVPFDQQSLSPAHQAAPFSQQSGSSRQQANPFALQSISSTQQAAPFWQKGMEFWQQTKPFWYQNVVFGGFSGQLGARSYYTLGVIKHYSLDSNLFKNLGATVQAFPMWKLLF